VNTFEDQWPPWLWRPAYHAGQAYALGAETGPLALCDRPQLLAEAGLPTSPARLTRDWSTWQGFLAFGREFRQRIPKGPAFMDSVTGMFDAMVSQATPATAGSSRPAGGPAVRRAWASAAKAAQDGLGVPPGAHMLAGPVESQSARPFGVCRHGFHAVANGVLPVATAWSAPQPHETFMTRHD
jgi:hypothetical protein